MRFKIAICSGLVLYALLSATDWVMTFALLRSHPGAVESNPLAAACLKHFGWAGLAVYKLAGVLIFAGAVVLLARRRPAVATGIVALGCAALLAVTIYTHGLICESYREDQQLAKWEYPKRKPIKSLIPSACWFAREPAVETAGGK